MSMSFYSVLFPPQIIARGAAVRGANRTRDKVEKMVTELEAKHRQCIKLLASDVIGQEISSLATGVPALTMYMS